MSNQQDIIISDLDGFQAVAIKLYAETYYLCKYLGKEEHARLVESAVEECVGDGETDKVAIAEWWNERISSPIFQFQKKEPPKPLIIIP